ncbi:hypothetical protein STRDD10_00145 [Streptococcus sp. DD10]|nr:hypothetical protein STRDD10_00145 [Streptococcus sp. DD10]
MELTKLAQNTVLRLQIELTWFEEILERVLNVYFSLNS